ncbi:LOB domain-containing protein 4-like [Zingiber officinale]|uniref:LOB domain-containing protein 4-like n=1 Tax=Zingiber officinale TaxID=94328 RepID=UPI001C4B77C4|nr:LOB domain-containing protein 4-like [Zingiber officinale]XP_042461199.1 LOB domain-containing protein 4-like [Zingiber officinale]
MIARRRRIYIMVMSKERRKKSNSSSIASPCAACKLLRRRCAQDCIFAPHFPAEEPHKFANVHRVFGASNISKLLQEVTVGQRGDAVSSLVYEANARLRDPVYGCVAAISSLHRQIQALQAQLAMAQAQVVHLRLGHAACCLALRQRPTTAPAGSSAGTEDKAASQVVALDMVVVEESNLGDQPPIWFG